MTPPVNPNPVQKSLTDLLDEIELRYQRSIADPYDPEVCENSIRDNPALVKALRRVVEIWETKYIAPAARAYCEDLAQLLREPAEDVK